jgi:hypothetical protein
MDQETGHTWQAQFSKKAGGNITIFIGTESPQNVTESRAPARSKKAESPRNITGPGASALNEKAIEYGCATAPVFVADEMYRCTTQSGTFAYFVVPGGAPDLAKASKTPQQQGASKQP